MSLLSLEKYLYAPVGKDGPSANLPSVTGYFGFASRIVQSIRSGFKGEALLDLAAALEALGMHLDPNQEAEDLNRSARIFDGLWAEFQNRLKKADQDRADDFRKVLLSLKETFGALSAGTQGTDLRFHKLDESLQVATKMDDLATLRTHLTQTLQFVRQEASRERRRSRGLLDVLGNQIRKSEENVNRMSGALSTRADAISAMNSTLDEEGNGEMEVMIFVADILKRLTLVHGNGISDSLLDELTRQKLQHFASEGKVFRWSSTSVVLFCKGADRTDSLARTDGSPHSLFEYQAFLGDRVANFRVALRSLAVPLRGELAEITNTLDSFAH